MASNLNNKGWGKSPPYKEKKGKKMYFETTKQIYEYLENQIVDVLTVNKTSLDENLEILHRLKDYVGESIELLEKEKRDWGD